MNYTLKQFLSWQVDILTQNWKDFKILRPLKKNNFKFYLFLSGRYLSENKILKVAMKL